MAKRTVNPLIKAMNEGIANHRQSAKRSMENAKFGLSVKAILRAKYAPIFAGVDTKNTDISFHSSWNEATVSVFMWKLDSFKDERLTGLLERLMDYNGNPEVHEYADALNKDFHFKLDDVTIRVCAYVKTDSPTCRRVQVDTKTVEQPVYKILCD